MKDDHCSYTRNFLFRLSFRNCKSCVYIITAMIILHLILHSAVRSHFHIFKTSSSPFHGFITNQFNENPSSKASCKAMKLTKSSLFLKTMISDFFLSNGAFLNHNPLNKSAKNNKRMLIAAVFYFVDAV